MSDHQSAINNHQSSISNRTSHPVRRTSSARRYFLFVALILISLACSIPGLVKPPTPVATELVAPTFTPAPPTPTPQPLPPAIVESDPPLGGELPLDGPIILYFNQEMDRSSVESALRLQPELSSEFTWRNDATLVIAPAELLAPESQITLDLEPGARSRRGLSLTEPVSLSFRTVGYLRLAQTLPEKDASDVDPSSAVVANFNRSVVPLGADPASLPPAFTLQPAATGRGEWLNTSTYIFYPEPPLEGGKSYSVALNPDLKGVDTSPLESAEGWTFSTAEPRLLTILPDPTAGDIRLDSVITMTFNQPMDPQSVQANFALLGEGSTPVSGEMAWNDDLTTLTFKPTNILQRSTTYSVDLKKDAHARGGTPLGADFHTSLRSVAPLAVVNSKPSQGGTKSQFDWIELYLNGPIVEKDLRDHILVTPPVSYMDAYWYAENRMINLYGDFAPDTDYSLTLLPSLSDPWGGSLAQSYVLNFRTAPLNPELVLNYGTDVLFLTPQDASLIVQAVNYPSASTSVGSVPLGDFIAMISGQISYDYRRTYQSSDERTWTQRFDLLPNRSTPVDLYISPRRTPLSPGLYYLRFNNTGENFYAGPFLIAVANAQMTFKLSATQAMVWAVDLRDNTPIAGALVSVYNDKGEALAQGTTDDQGIFQSEIPDLKDPYATYYAELGQPGDDLFGMALSTWNQGLASWDFGIPTDYSGPRLEAYLYTDRPIYRPGQTVYFRAIVRQAHNGRYTLPDLASLPLTLYKNYSEELISFDLPLSALGTAHGEYTLPADAPPGDYRIADPNNEYGISVPFQVAEYRKPEINLQVSFAADQVKAGDDLTAQVQARYFFDAPAGNLPVQWALYATPSEFYLSDYQVGLQDTSWLEAYYYPSFYDPLGMQVLQGEATTDPQGLLTLELPTKVEEGRLKYTVEVTMKDESGLPVSARASAEANPAPFYIGLRPDTWVGRAGEPSGFETQVVDWQRDPVGPNALRAEFRKVVWVEEERPFNERYEGPKYVPQYTPVGSTDFQTNAQGQARLSFTPPEPGTYSLIVSGNGASSELYVWVGGPGNAVWPNLPNQRLRLVADRESYRPGDTAQVFLPNPLGSNANVLVTVERGLVMRHEVIDLAPGGSTLSFPLSADDAPNVYVAVTLLGTHETGSPDFRQGYVNLPVQPSEQTLYLTLTSQPERLGPGDEVSFEVRVTDADGQPMQGEFSLSLVDKAVLALADPNVPDIVSYFYGEQPLGVRTALALAAYARRESFLQAEGRGGGGGEAIASVVREHFPDTAYWNAEIVTGPDGRAQVSLPLPDSLTTWQVLVRGVAGDTRVGQAEIEVVVTKDLLVRPVTPRFLVVGDHVQLAAVVQNNTSTDMQADVSVQASGFTLDDPVASSQTVSLPANGRARVEWWGAVQDVPAVELTFSASAQSGGVTYQDAARPALGDLPVLHYTAPETFATAGTLDEGGERLELVSLPRSFDTQGGELRLELSSSLGGTMIASLDALEKTHYECTEPTLSRFLPNLEAYRVLQELKVDSPALQGRLARTLVDSIGRLLARQKPDGGWDWCGGDVSNPYVTAYVLFGLSRARESGAKISDATIQRAVDFLMASLYTPDMTTETWQLNRLAFVHFALAYAGSGDLYGVQTLYQARERLSPWAKAVLALAFQRLEPDNDDANTLLSDLSSSAMRSATGAHWEEAQPDVQNMSSPLLTSAMVVYALAQGQPDSPLLADAVRYLMAHRRVNGTWGSSYTNAWILMSLAEVMRATGELGGSFGFFATLNGVPIANGQASGEGAPVVADIPIGDLYVGDPNALSVQRGPGSGRLYYTADLNVYRPVEGVTPVQNGVTVERKYYPTGAACPRGDCAPIESARPGELVQARLTVTVEQAAYYLLLEDYLPAGTEVLDTGLKTTQLGMPEEEPQQEPLFDPRRPFEAGWGWWYFTSPRFYDDRVNWAAAYLPPGTYQLTYLLVTLQPGEYRVLPARAWMFYFPETQGNSAGAIFTVHP